MKKEKVIELFKPFFTKEEGFKIKDEKGKNQIWIKKYHKEKDNYFVICDLYSYHDVGMDDAIWYIYIRCYGSERYEFILPDHDTSIFIEIFKQKLLNFIKVKSELDNYRQELIDLEKNKKSEIRNYKLKSITDI